MKKRMIYILQQNGLYVHGNFNEEKDDLHTSALANRMVLYVHEDLWKLQ